MPYKTILKNANNRDTLQAMAAIAVLTAKKDKDFRRWVLDRRVMLGPGIVSIADTLLRIFSNVLNNSYFYPHPINHQIIRPPMVLLRDRKANCVDYSTFMAAAALSLGITDVYFKAVGNEAGQYIHVYPVIDGVIYDLTINQEQTGLEESQRNGHITGRLGFEVQHKFSIIQKVCN